MGALCSFLYHEKVSFLASLPTLSFLNQKLYRFSFVEKISMGIVKCIENNFSLQKNSEMLEKVDEFSVPLRYFKTRDDC